MTAERPPELRDIWAEAAATGSPGYARIAQLGLSGTGKTFSSVMIALEIRERFGLDGPIGALDTENGYEYLSPIVLKVTGQPLLVIKSRNIDEWIEAIDRAEERGNMALLGDSVTHVWKQLCDGYLHQLQASARERGWRTIPQKLELKDWHPIKKQWARFTDRFMNARVHMVMNGRAGWTWDMDDDGRGKKELIKKDVKFKAEGEFEFEAGLSLHYERHRTSLDEGQYHTVTVRKDRTDRIMGKVFRFVPKDTPPRAVAGFIRPHLDALHPLDFQPTDLAGGHDFQLDEMGNDSRARRDQDRSIILEKIQAGMLARHPSQSAADKKARLGLMQELFGTSSQTELDKRVPISDLYNGMDKLLAMPSDPEGGP